MTARFLSALLLLVLAAVPCRAAEEKVLSSPDEILSFEGQDVRVEGQWMLETGSLLPSNTALRVVRGNLRFAPDTKIQFDDLTILPTNGVGVTLWQVEGGTVSGCPVLDPPSSQWTVSVSSDGCTGRLVPFTPEYSWLDDVARQFHECFVAKGRWKYLTSGLLITLEVALCAVLLGAILGFCVAIVRFTHDKYGRFAVLNAVMKCYLTIVRGTPVAVQLLIAYFVIFASCNNKTLVAILAFGFNSGAYVAEIIRAGLASIEDGQMEAGRSLGFGYLQTMRLVILPQAIRNVLPALGNEFIVLLKDTSIASFIALQDLSKGGEIIRSQTYNVYMPFLMVAAIYLVLVMTFTWLLGKLERHLRNTGADVVHNDS